SDVRLSLQAFRGASINDAEDTTALFALRDDDFHGVGGRAENGADLRHVTDGIQYVDGIGVLNDQHESVATSQRLGIANGDIAKGVVIAIRAREAGSGAFV